MLDIIKNIIQKLDKIKKRVAGNIRLKVYEPHFEKLLVANQRNRVIYDMAIASINYDNAKSESERIRYLREMFDLNEKNFGSIILDDEADQASLNTMIRK